MSLMALVTKEESLWLYANERKFLGHGTTIERFEKCGILSVSIFF